MKVRLWLVIILVILSILGVALANSGFTGYTVGKKQLPIKKKTIIAQDKTG